MGVMLGPFELIEPAAKGGMAEVWRGIHRERDVPVAIKIIMGEFATDPTYHARFADEVRAVAALDHPGIVTVLDHGKVDGSAALGSEGRLRAGTPWLAMEYCSMGTLSKLKMPLNWNQVHGMLLATLDALAHAHARGVIHRDLKPPNLLRAGPRDLRPGLKLSDFGIAWIGQDETGIPMGTPRFMAPEQIQMHWRDYGPWTDLYALGCLAWWLVAGKTPFHALRIPDTLVGHLHRDPPFFDAQFAVPEDFEAWVRVLLQKRPRDRYQRAADAAGALIRMGPPVEVEPEPQDGMVSSTMVALSGSWSEPSGPLSSSGPRAAPATIPEGWRHRRVAPAPPALVGAGLSLFGLRTLPVAGRTRERDRLWSQLIEVHRTGRPHAVLISGAAGTGKSRLAEWLCQRAHEVGAAAIGRATFSPELAPGQALQRMGRDFYGVHGLDREDVAARVEEWMAPLGASPEERMVLTEILQPATEEDLVSGAPSVRLTGPRDYLGAISAAFRSLSSERPMIAWLDDVQWGVHGLGLALQMLEQTERMPVLLILTLRTEALPEDGPEARRVARLVEHPACESLALEPLSPAEHRALVGDLMGSLDPKLSARLLERTAGNPLFAVQLLGSWVRRGVLVPSEGGLVLAPGADAALPVDLQQVWREQIDREVASFGPAAMGYLELAAVLGHTVDRKEWRSVCDDPEGFFGDRFPGDESLRAALVERLLTVRLAVGTVARWSFVHGMLRESLEQRARDGGRLQEHHLACAQMLGRQTDLQVQERLGRHLLAAGLADRAIEHLLRGVSVRRLTVGPEPALALLALAEDAIAEAQLPASDARHGELGVLRARIAADAGETADAEHAVAAALVAALAHGWEEVRVEATTVRTELRLAARQHTEAEIDLNALRELALSLDHQLRAGTANIGLAEVSRARGDFVKATGLLRQALEALETAPPSLEARVEEAKAWRLLGRCAEATGDADEARGRYEGARERYDRLGYALGSADCLDRLGRIAAEAGELAASVESFSAALSRYEALGSERRFTCRLRLGLAQARAGAPEAAWDAVAGVQAVGAHLDREGSVALGHALRMVRASVDRDWKAWAAAFAQTASALPRKGIAPGLVAWLGHIAGVLTAAAGQQPLAAQALRASSAIWAASGQIGQAAEVATALEELDDH